jgi:hypothetical protein
MKTWPRAGAFLLILALLQFGCGKGDQSAKPADYSGVQIDVPQLKKAFASSPDTLRLANDVEFGLRYGDFPKALQALEGLTNNANCTEDQKKLVATTMEQVKKLAEKASATPGQ